MSYLLFAIAAFMAVVTAFILNSMSKTKKYSFLNRVLVLIFSISIYIMLAIYLLQQKNL